jgi:hypothetical protein
LSFASRTQEIIQELASIEAFTSAKILDFDFTEAENERNRNTMHLALEN